MGKLDDKVAIITGGANGIGYQTVKCFVDEGARVVFTDIDKDKGNAVADEFEDEAVIFVQHDVSKEENWANVVATAKEEFGKIDILFNNAGIYKIKNLVDTSVDEWNELMSINVTGVFLGMKHVAPEMAGNKEGGSIINASSVAGLRGVSGHAMYGASKGAVRIMSKDVAAEYAKEQVRVNTIHPGYITTEMSEYASKTTGQSKEELDSTYPLGRMGSPEDVANTVLFLASNDSKYITGSELTIDGGSSNIM